MGLLIDANVFITLERTKRSVATVNALTTERDFGIASITASELLSGALRIKDEIRREERTEVNEALIAMFSVYDFDLAAARVHAYFMHDLEQKGLPIGAHGAIITATAQAFGFGVLTDNLSEFQRVPGLRVVQPMSIASSEY